jgi:hypothetical protein
MSPLWTVYVVLHAENRVELHADVDGHPMHASEAFDLPFGVMVDQLEAWLGATEEGAHIALTVRTPEGQTHVMETRRWRVALYFLLAEYERSFVRRHGVTERPSIKLESGPVSTDAPLDGVRRSKQNGSDR